MSLTGILYLSIAISSSLLLYNKILGKSQPAPFPPGPKPLPLIGNLQDMPKSKTYRTFGEWAKTYGDIVHVEVLGYHIIVLNDLKYVNEILESKSRLYSERPALMMAGKLIGWEDGPALRPFDDVWSKQRKYISNFLGTRSKVEGFESMINEEIKKLLPRLLTNPEKQLELFQLFAGSVVLMLVYGYQVADDDDLLIKIVTEAMDNFGEVTQSGAFAVDFFPLLNLIPSWFPGASWKTKATKYRQTLDEMLKRPFGWTKEQMKLGTARSCFVTNILEKGEFSAKEEKIIQWSAGATYAGGAHTTAGALSCFLLAMVRHTPELLKAQEEIQAVIGNDRLPTLADRPHLPYFEALCMEVNRCYTIGPLGLQHVAREDDIHNGYFIPKGSIVLVNNILFHRDEKLYSHSDKFLPERFLEFDADSKRKQRDPAEFMFGYGRRSCPGVHLANAMLWLASAALITVFDFKPIIKNGKPVIPSAKFVGELITHPEPFEYVATSKSNLWESFIRGCY